MNHKYLHCLQTLMTPGNKPKALVRAGIANQLQSSLRHQTLQNATLLADNSPVLKYPKLSKLDVPAFNSQQITRPPLASPKLPQGRSAQASDTSAWPAATNRSRLKSASQTGDIRKKPSLSMDTLRKSASRVTSQHAVTDTNDTHSLKQQEKASRDASRGLYMLRTASNSTLRSVTPVRVGLAKAAAKSQDFVKKQNKVPASKSLLSRKAAALRRPSRPTRPKSQTILHQYFKQ